MKSRRELLRQTGALALASQLQAATLPRRHPYVQHLLTNRCTLFWATNEAGSASVQVSADEAFSDPATVPARARRIEPAESQLDSSFTQWEADLTGLAPGTRYYYRIYLGSERLLAEAAPAELSFQTAPTSGGLRFIVFGDSGGNTPEQFELRDWMLKEQAALAVHTGDIAYPFGSHQTYESYYLNVYRELMKQVPVYPAVGNHDIEWQEGAPYFGLHACPLEGVQGRDHKRYYSFDWGDVHFVSLDSNLLPDSSRGRPMLDWLNADLANSRKTWRIVAWHHTPYDGVRGEEPEARLARALVVPILERHRVQLVLAGHSHVYERTHPLLRGERAITAGDGIVYVTTGGAGGGLHDSVPHAQSAVALSAAHYLRIEVDGLRLSVHAIGRGGREFDRFAITTRPGPGTTALVNAASFRQAVAPGSLVTIVGQNLAAAQASAQSLPLPIELAGVRASLNGREVPLTFASPEQVTAQLPFFIAASAGASLRLSDAEGGNGLDIPINLLPAAPGIFETAAGPSISRADGQLITASAPARPGEVVSIFLTGLGDVRGAVAAGASAPGSPPVIVAARVEVELDLGQRMPPSFAGLAPGQAGIYQVNARLPGDLTTGRHSVAVRANGVRSNEVVIFVA